MRYFPLFNLKLTHPYYSDDRCGDFQIEPDQRTQRVLNNQKCLFKAFSNGVRILTAVTSDGEPLIPLQSETCFRFHLRLRKHDFALFTDLTDINALSAPVYSNAGNNGSGSPASLTLLPRFLRVTEAFQVRVPGQEEAFTLRG